MKINLKDEKSSRYGYAGRRGRRPLQKIGLNKAQFLNIPIAGRRGRRPLQIIRF